MSRVLLVAMGIPAYVPARRHGGPGLRAAHFAHALSRCGAEVLVVCVCTAADEAPLRSGVDSDSPQAPDGVETVFVDERGLLAGSLRRRIEEFSPDAVVGVTVYAAALALRLGLDVPLWADVFGDLLSEAQAKASAGGSDWSLVHFWTLLRPVLEGADRFSAVSHAQSHALVGQLGLAGRLSERTAGEEFVCVIPCAAEAPAVTPSREEARLRLGIPSDAFVLLWSGGFNTWCDVDSAAAGVVAAMKENPHLHLVVSGGAIPGHDENSFAKFRRGLDVAVGSGLAASAVNAALRTRIHMLGWVASTELPFLYAASDLGLNIERNLYERRLGGENRVAEWLAHGLPCVTTALSEAGGQLVREGLAWQVAVADAASLARRILELASNPALVAATAAKGREAAAQKLGFAATALALSAWCEAPTRAADHGVERFVRLGLLSRPQASTEILEAYVRELPLSELLRRGLRWTLRRAFGSAGGAALVVAALVGALGALGCQSSSESAPQSTQASAAAKPNIVLITVDSLRPDHLGAYGYSVGATRLSPWIDRVASRGVVIEQSITSSPETAPAIASILTGLYQDRHGVTSNGLQLANKQIVLADRLTELGYATAAFVANHSIDASRGFNQGFDHFELIDGEMPFLYSTDDRTVARALEWLRRMPPGKPWFVWVNLIDPHGPYLSAPEWWSRDFKYAGPRFQGESDTAFGISNFGLGVIPAYQKIEGVQRLSGYLRRYDGEIRFADAEVGALLGGVAIDGDLDDTLVVVTADHGESLTEHSELLQHGWFVYDTTVKVPLLFSWPRRFTGGRRIDGQVCSVDIVPTVLDLLGSPASAADLDGISIAPLLLADEKGRSAAASGAQAAASPSERECFCVGARANHPFSLRAGGYKLILSPAGGAADPSAEIDETKATAPRTDTDRLELYDLGSDPDEMRELHSDQPEIVEDMEGKLIAFRARFRSRGWRW